MKSKILIILVISILAFFMVFSNCSIITDRWNIEWHQANPTGTRSLQIFNKTNETISSIKYYVGDIPPSDWTSGGTTIYGSINPGQSTLYRVDPGQSISADDGDVVWIRVAASDWNQSQLFAVDGFTSEAGDVWQALIYNK